MLLYDKAKNSTCADSPLPFISLYSMPSNTPHYHLLLLGLWLESEAEPRRYGLENPHTGERIGFQNEAELFRFLQVWSGGSFEAASALLAEQQPNQAGTPPST